MAGSSGSRSSLLHNFHQGRGGGGTGGWATFVSRSYGSLPKNTTRYKNSPRPSSALVANCVSRSYASWS